MSPALARNLESTASSDPFIGASTAADLRVTTAPIPIEPAKEIGVMTQGERNGAGDVEERPAVRIHPPRSKFLPLQKWEGTVLKIRKDSFICRLTDLNRKGLHEEAEIPIEEVPTTDRPLIELGAVFYWNIGYLDNEVGQRIRASIIRFRRLPVWTKSEIDKAKLEATRLRALFERR
jgi:hypothetical protein